MSKASDLRRVLITTARELRKTAEEVRVVGLRHPGHYSKDADPRSAVNQTMAADKAAILTQAAHLATLAAEAEKVIGETG